MMLRVKLMILEHKKEKNSIITARRKKKLMRIG